MVRELSTTEGTERRVPMVCLLLFQGKDIRYDVDVQRLVRSRHRIESTATEGSHRNREHTFDDKPCTYE
jgi:hypothetical protein